MTAAFKGVVWPRQSVKNPPFEEVKPIEVNGKKLYRYAVVGVIVSDRPCPEFEQLEEVLGRKTVDAVLCGSAPGLLEALANIPRGDIAFELGDASSVLCSLDRIQPKP